MKLTIDRDVLADATHAAARIIPARPAAPVLAGILLEADATALTLKAFDYETSHRSTVSADVDTPGRVLVQGKLLADVVKSLPNKPVTVEVTGAQVVIKAGAARFSLLTMPVEDFPDLPEIPPVTTTLDAGEFAHALAQAAVAVSRDDTLPLLTSIRLEATGGVLSILATDRYRLAHRDLPHTGTLEGAWQVRAKTLLDAVKGKTGPVDVAFTDRLVAFTTGPTTVTTVPVDGEYPPVRRLFPDHTPTVAHVNVSELVDAVKRVALVAERNTPVRLAFTDTEVTLTAGSTDASAASETLPCQTEGGDIEVAFNPTFLIDGLTALDTPHAQLGFTHGNKPVLFTGVNSDSEQVDGYRYLLVPIRFAN